MRAHELPDDLSANDVERTLREVEDSDGRVEPRLDSVFLEMTRRSESSAPAHAPERIKWAVGTLPET